MNEYEIPQPNKSLRNILLLVGAVVLVAFLAAVTYYETKVNKGASSESREVTFTVQKGQRTRTIAENLEREKVISSPNIFLIYTLLHQASGQIQAGSYSLDANMAIPEIVDVLTHGKVVPSGRNVTVIEGWTNEQITKYLDSRGIIQRNDFEQTLANHFDSIRLADTGLKYSYQGFLFPDTYTIAANATASDLVSKMLNNFQSKISDKMLADMQADSRTLGQVIILASIIEKEVGRNKQTLTDDDLRIMQQERELVASVFYNRLEIGMPLESDATVNYVTGKTDRSVSIADTKIKSPYNTYANRGLPPTPISNPGLGSIKAAIYPTNSDYLFFLNSPDGTAYFAKTLAEHNANRAKYLK